MITIRPVLPEEAATLASLGARLFEETYRDVIDRADMAAHLAAVYVVDRQRAELFSPDAITLFVDANHTPAGYIQVRRAVPPEGVESTAAIELRWFYLDSRFHGQRVGPSMMAAAHDAARELGGDEMWLSVWTKNPRAIAFYRKCGFEQIGTSEFDVGDDRQTDLIMAISVDGQAPE